MIKRSILPDLREHLSEKEMTILIGARQVGKTYLMRLLEEELKQKGEKTLFLNLDIEAHKLIFTSQAKLISYIELQLGKEKAYVFIDEIQKKNNAEIFLKGIADMELPYKFIISGSGSLELKAKVKESMAGRKRMFIIDPISFEEFVDFRTDYRYRAKLQDFFALMEAETTQLLEEYMVYGGYPKVVLADTAEKKINEMEEIYESYIDRDIKILLNVLKGDAFTSLVKVMASQIGSMVNTSELSSTIGVADQTIQHYLYYLEKTFIMKKVTPYYHNVRSEITKAPIYYFVDSGLRNWILGLFGLPQIPPPLRGHLFENVIFNLLRQHSSLPATIHFWRTQDKAEVDFVINTGLEVIPVKVRYTRLKTPETTRSFKSFLTKYRPKKAYIVHLGEYMEDTFEDTKIFFLPFYLCQGILQ